jgi:hypothetical protein
LTRPVIALWRNSREDLLRLDGSWLVDDPQTDRRRLLERLHQLSDGTLGVLSWFPRRRP